MEIWYMARFCKVGEVRITRHPEQSVFLSNGRRLAKDSNWYWYRPTREEAKNAMITAYEVSVRNAEEEVMRMKAEVAKAKLA